MQNYYFHEKHPLRPYTHNLPATPGTIAPSNALRKAPPFSFVFAGDGSHKLENVPEAYKGEWYGEKDGAWVPIEAHQGKQGYVDGKPHTIDDFGPLPEGWSADPPPQPFDPGPDYEKREDGVFVRWRYSRKDFLLWCGIDKVAALNAARAAGNVMVETAKDLMMAAEYISIRDPDTVQMLGLLATPEGGNILTGDDVTRILAGQEVREPEAA